MCVSYRCVHGNGIGILHVAKVEYHINININTSGII